MTTEIFKVLNKILDRENATGPVCQFVRSVVQYECEDNTTQFRKRYNDMMARSLERED